MVTYSWITDPAPMCIESTVISIGGVDSTPMMNMVDATYCCLSGATAEPDDIALTVACENTDILSSAVTYNWDSSSEVCTE